MREVIQLEFQLADCEAQREEAVAELKAAIAAGGLRGESQVHVKKALGILKEAVGSSE